MRKKYYFHTALKRFIKRQVVMEAETKKRAYLNVRQHGGYGIGNEIGIQGGN